MTEEQLTKVLGALFESVPPTREGYRMAWRAFRSVLEGRAEILFHVGCSPPFRFYENGKPFDYPIEYAAIQNELREP